MDQLPLLPLNKRTVGLSNILDSELTWRTPCEGPYGKVIGAAVMDGELLIKIVQRIKTVAGIEAFLVLPVAALHFSVVPWCVGTDELVVYTELCSGSLKQGGQVTFAVGETISELKSVVRLDALHPDTPAGIPLEQPLQKVSRRVGALLGIGGQEAQAGEFIYGSVLEQAQLRVCNTPAGYDFHIHLDPLAWIGHLLVGLGFVRLFLLCRWKHPQLPHHPEQALRTACITPQPQPMPQFHHAKAGISAAQIPDEFEFCFCVLIWMAVGTPGLTGQRARRSVPAGLPEVDVRPALVVLPAGTAHAVFLRILHQGLPICHVLCYTLAHEGYSPLSFSCCSQLQL